MHKHLLHSNWEWAGGYSVHTQSSIPEQHSMRSAGADVLPYSPALAESFKHQPCCTAWPGLLQGSNAPLQACNRHWPALYPDMTQAGPAGQSIASYVGQSVTRLYIAHACCDTYAPAYGTTCCPHPQARPSTRSTMSSPTTTCLWTHLVWCWGSCCWQQQCLQQCWAQAAPCGAQQL